MLKHIDFKYINKTLFIIIVLYFFFLNAPTLHAADVTLSWDAPLSNVDGTSLTDLNGYTIYYGVESGNYTQTVAVTDETATTYQVTNLTEETTYYFTISANNTSGNESDYSNEVSKTVQGTDTTPPVISGVYASDITTTSAAIHWTTDEASDTQVEYDTDISYGNTTTLDTSHVTNHSQTISNLSPSTQYYYRVLSSDTSGNTTMDDNNYTFTTASEPDMTPPVLSNIQVVDITDSSVTITWTTDEPSTSQIEYGINTSYGNLTPLDSNLLTTHSVIITGLSSYTVYDFRVRSEDASSNEALSSNNTFTTSNLSPTIISFSADPVSGNVPLTVNFSVDASDSDGYIVKYEWDFTGEGNYVENTAAPYYVYENSGSYTARVRVTDDGGEITVSDTITITVNSWGSQPPIIRFVSCFPVFEAGGIKVVCTVTVWFSYGTTRNPLMYEWDFDGNGTYDVTTNSVPVSYVYSNAAVRIYRVRVKVTDEQGGTALGATTVNW